MKFALTLVCLMTAQAVSLKQMDSYQDAHWKYYKDWEAQELKKADSKADKMMNLLDSDSSGDVSKDDLLAYYGPEAAPHLQYYFDHEDFNGDGIINRDDYIAKEMADVYKYRD